MLRNTGAPPDLWKYGISGDLPIVLVTVVRRRRGGARAGARTRAGVPAREGVQVRSRRPERDPDELPPGRAGGSAAHGGVGPIERLDGSARRTVPSPRRCHVPRRIACCCGRSRARFSKAFARRARRAAAAAADSFGAADRGSSATPVGSQGERAGAGQRRAAGVLQRFRRVYEGRPRVSCDRRGPRRPGRTSSRTQRFGFVATESGLGNTWSENSYQNRLTPWNNDPVVDPPGEVIYLRDDQSGEFWTATASPAGGANRTRHQVRPGLRDLRTLASWPACRADRVRSSR